MTLVASLTCRNGRQRYVPFCTARVVVVSPPSPHLTRVSPFSQALDHVNWEVAEEVQDALLALRDHATALKLGENLRCDTTPELAELAQFAASSGLYTGFRTARK